MVIVETVVDTGGISGLLHARKKKWPEPQENEDVAHRILVSHVR